MILLDVLKRAITDEDSGGTPDRTWLEVTDKGHTFISLLVGFLLVSRVSNALGRYWTARDGIGTMYRICRDIVQMACIFSSTYSSVSKISKVEGADADRRNQMVQRGQWFRHILIYRVLALLQSSMAMVSYPTTKVPAWDIPELNGPELNDVRQMVFQNQLSCSGELDTADPEIGRLLNGQVNEWEETMRVPIRLAYLLRHTIHAGAEPDNLEQHCSILSSTSSPVRELSLLNNVSQLMEGHFALQKFMTTPVPPPLVYMSRTFVYLWVYTVPFVFLRDSTSTLWSRCVAVLILTLGFVGLELIAHQLDNPFGSDLIDLPHM
jgi:Bestrophin, RFP-TM, chloride channel